MESIITVGSATYDIFLRNPTGHQIKQCVRDHHVSTCLPEGSKIDVGDLHYAVGGGAINAAVALHKLGYNATPWCTVGTDFAGTFIREHVKKLGISTELIVADPEHLTGASCILPCPSGNATLFVYRGASTYALTNEMQCRFISAPWWYCAPLSGEAATQYADLFEHLRPYAKGIFCNPSVWQLTAGAADFLRMLPGVDIIVCNAREARLCLERLLSSAYSVVPEIRYGHDSTEGDLLLAPLPPLLRQFGVLGELPVNIAQYVELLQRTGPSIIIVTDGARGAYVAHRQKIYFHPALAIDPLNTVGAGDAFGATFFANIIAGETIPVSLARAMVNSSAVLQGEDSTSGLLGQEELMERYSRIGISLVQEYVYEVLH